ncbi:MAG: hypothetical protein ACXW32_00965 [Limisphaerales bacterium]
MTHIGFSAGERMLGVGYSISIQRMSQGLSLIDTSPSRSEGPKWTTRILFTGAFGSSATIRQFRVEIDAQTLTQVVNLFLEGQFPDGEAERCCDSNESFTVARVESAKSS